MMADIHPVNTTDLNSDIGVAHGRFQIFHKDHLKYLLAAKSNCSMLVVGITSPDPDQSPAEAADENRGDPAANPCTYYERMLMIEAALLESGVHRSAFQIVPFPIGFPQRLKYYVPSGARYYLTIYDAWGETKLARLKALNLDARVLWRDSIKSMSATQIRRAIIEGGEWENLVPAATARIVRNLGIDARIREQYRASAFDKDFVVR